MRHLHLIARLPDLFTDRAADSPLADLPGLGALLKRGHHRPAATGLSAACCEAFGIGAQPACPIAPYSARAAGLDVDERRYWLRLDPVFLDVGMQGVFLQADIQLDAEGARALAKIIEEVMHRVGMDTLELHGAADEALYVALDHEPKLNTTPLDNVAGRQPGRFLPSGEDAPFWTRLLHEIQMELHDHPFNQSRQAAGKHPINSLWPWGGGRFVQSVHRLDAVWADPTLPQQLAKALDIPAHPCPAGLAQVLSSPGNLGLVALDSPGDTHTAEYLQKWETRWFRPALKALQRGRLASVHLNLLGSPPESRHLTPRSAWRLWA